MISTHRYIVVLSCCIFQKKTHMSMTNPRTNKNIIDNKSSSTKRKNAIQIQNPIPWKKKEEKGRETHEEFEAAEASDE